MKTSSKKTRAKKVNPLEIGEALRVQTDVRAGTPHPIYCDGCGLGRPGGPAV